MSQPPARQGDSPGPVRTVSDRACIACLESIPAVARRCPECGAPQRAPGPGARLLKLASVIFALLTFVLGVRQLTNMAIARFSRGATLELHVEVARELIRLGEYAAAWNQLEGAPRDARTTEVRLQLARHWMLDASELESGMSLGELAKRLALVIAPAATSGAPRQRADCQALLAYAQVMRGREEPVASGAVVQLFEEALAEDDTSAMAHMLYGHYLVSYENELENGLEHLEHAVELEREQPDPALPTRQWQLSALNNFRRSNRHRSDEPSAANPGWQARVALLRFANDLRTAAEWTPADGTGLHQDALDVDRDWRRLIDAYDLSSAEALAELRRALPPAEHMALLAWLEAEGPGSARISQRAYVSAMLHEDLGDTAAAVAALVSTPPHYRLRDAFDELHQRLTGRPLGPLSERDPWAYRAEVLARAEPGDSELVEVFEQLELYMHLHRRGRRWSDAESLHAIAGGRRAFAERQRQADSQNDEVRELDRQLALYEGELLLAAGRATEAVSTLELLVQEMPAGHALRGRALVELAAAHATTADEAGLAASVARIREAVEEEEWSDWAWIRWRPMLGPLHARADYVALLERHGRRAGPPGSRGPSDGK